MSLCPNAEIPNACLVLALYLVVGQFVSQWIVIFRV